MDTRQTGAFIAALRKEKGMTQEQLARTLFLTHTAVSKWERGLGFPDVSVIEPLAETLGVTVTELFRGQREEIVSREGERAARDALRLTKMTRRREKLLWWLAALCLFLTAAGALFFALWRGSLRLPDPPVRGTYQTDLTPGANDTRQRDGPVFFTLSVQDWGEEHSVALYADSTLLDSGTWEKPMPGYYIFHGEKARFSTQLHRDGSLYLLLPGMETPVTLTRRGEAPVYFPSYPQTGACDWLLRP